jgi:hypothetical protein
MITIIGVSLILGLALAVIITLSLVYYLKSKNIT